MPGVIYVDLSFEVSITVLSFSKPQHTFKWMSVVTRCESPHRKAEWKECCPSGSSCQDRCLSPKKKITVLCSIAQTGISAHTFRQFILIQWFWEWPSPYLQVSCSLPFRYELQKKQIFSLSGLFGMFQNMVLVIWANSNDYIHHMVNRNRKKVGKWSKSSVCFYTELITHAAFPIDWLIWLNRTLAAFISCIDLWHCCMSS